MSRVPKIRPNVNDMCMTRLGAELNQWLAELVKADIVPRNSVGFRRAGPEFVLNYGRERHVVPHTVVRAYVKALHDGFQGSHVDLPLA